MNSGSKDPQAPPDIKVPRSLAIIMDGNGRWAEERGLERTKGHEHGADAVREVVEECARLGVEALTLYAFSEENWNRPAREVRLLMTLLERFLLQEREELRENDIRFVHVGRSHRLPADVLAKLTETERLLESCQGMVLCLAVSYGGRAEIVDAARALARKVRAGELDPDEIDEATFAAHLYRPELPDPDLLIRTAGELRVSNFLLWQISYAEMYVSDVCWPDFRKPHLWEAFRSYGRRVRKFGAVV